MCQPYRFALLQRVQNYYESLDVEQTKEVDTVFESCGMTDLLSIRLDRNLGWENNLDIWL